MPPDPDGGAPLDELQQAMAITAAAVACRIDALLPVAPTGPRKRLCEAMRMATLNGGKRLRPFLVTQSAALFAVPEDRALRVAAAVEMIHCYSLVHDDLPAMDDSDLRRGRPTLHRAFDEATAILAGDALLTEAFAVLADEATHPDAAVRCRLIAGLARAAGASGMVAGQVIDLAPERSELDLAGIRDLQTLKTGALIVESCRAGAILGDAPAAAGVALATYASCIGLAFQIVDDLLDTEASDEELGKPAGQDHLAGKATFVGRLGQEAARQTARSLSDQAVAALRPFGDAADMLRMAAEFVVTRRF